jgi:hypothetical protein
MRPRQPVAEAALGGIIARAKGTAHPASFDAGTGCGAIGQLPPLKGPGLALPFAERRGTAKPHTPTASKPGDSRRASRRYKPPSLPANTWGSSSFFQPFLDLHIASPPVFLRMTVWRFFEVKIPRFISH